MKNAVTTVAGLLDVPKEKSMSLHSVDRTVNLLTKNRGFKEILTFHKVTCILSLLKSLVIPLP